MFEFFTDMRHAPFIATALAAAVLAAVAGGVTGSLVVVRRSTYLAGAVSHCVLAGLGLARLLQRRFGVEWFTPMMGALLAAVAAALLLARFTARGSQRTDTVLSAVWTGGTALGVTFIAMTPGYQDDLMSYLFGAIVLVTPEDLVWMAALNAVTLVTVCVCYNRFLAVAFNEELARLRGVSTLRYEVVYQVLTALTVVLLVRTVGIVLAIALLTLPAATAGMLTRRLDRMMLVAVTIGVAVSVLGLALSYSPGLPPGATIVELALVAYGAVLLLKKF